MLDIKTETSQDWAKDTKILADLWVQLVSYINDINYKPVVAGVSQCNQYVKNVFVMGCLPMLCGASCIISKI